MVLAFDSTISGPNQDVSGFISLYVLPSEAWVTSLGFQCWFRSGLPLWEMYPYWDISLRIPLYNPNQEIRPYEGDYVRSVKYTSESHFSFVPILSSLGAGLLLALWYSGYYLTAVLLAVAMGYYVRSRYTPSLYSYFKYPLGVCLFFLTEVLLFLGFLVSLLCYYDRFQNLPDGSTAYGYGLSGTVLLLTSSYYATIVHYNRKNSMVDYLLRAVILTGLLFVCLQGLEFHVSRVSMDCNFYTSCCITVVCLHLSHVVGGLMMFLLVNVDLRSCSNLADMSIWYWHLVDVMWVVVFMAVYRF